MCFKHSAPCPLWINLFPHSTAVTCKREWQREGEEAKEISYCTQCFCNDLIEMMLCDLTCKSKPVTFSMSSNSLCRRKQAHCSFTEVQQQPGQNLTWAGRVNNWLVVNNMTFSNFVTGLAPFSFQICVDLLCEDQRCAVLASTQTRLIFVMCCHSGRLQQCMVHKIWVCLLLFNCWEF